MSTFFTNFTIVAKKYLCASKKTQIFGSVYQISQFLDDTFTSINELSFVN